MMKIAAHQTSRRGEGMNTEKRKQLKSSPESEPNLKGTLISVSVLGVVILVTWFGVLMLYLSR